MLQVQHVTYCSVPIANCLQLLITSPNTLPSPPPSTHPASYRVPYTPISPLNLQIIQPSNACNTRLSITPGISLQSPPSTSYSPPASSTLPPHTHQPPPRHQPHLSLHPTCVLIQTSFVVQSKFFMRKEERDSNSVIS